MGRASKSLKNTDPKNAQRAQADALRRLSSLRQSVQNQRQPDQRMRRGRIPARDLKHMPSNYQTPEAFRRKLLEAMKRKTPQGYEGSVKKYYRELAR